jgi:transcriptional regulator with PAS, ATPase and Fis domain
VGKHAATRKFVSYIERVSATASTVLITGETGTGKEVVARDIHEQSHRRGGPFVSVNCAAIPDTLIEAELFGHERGAYTGAHTAADGKFQQANGGTLFLDEIAELTQFAQAKILRVLETPEIWRLGGKRGMPVDVRIIAATNQDLEKLVAEGRFRSDLFYRLDVARMVLPPLRERRSDIPLLIDYYVRRMNQQFKRTIAGFTPKSMEELTRYDWPGNIRELRNVVEAAFIELPPCHVNVVELPELVRERLRLASTRTPEESEQILTALEEMHWNVSRAAERLHMSRMTVYRKLAKFGFSRKSAKSEGRSDDPDVTGTGTRVTPGLQKPSQVVSHREATASRSAAKGL